MSTSTADMTSTSSMSESQSRSFKIWIEAARPKTLPAAWIPVIVGTSLAWASGAAPRWHLFFCAFLSASFIQIGTNLANDAIDFKKGTDNEKRVGPRRVTQSGLLSSRTVMMGAIASLGIASLFAIPLLIQGGWPILAIGLASLFFAYGYTGGPFPLAYLGLGEVFVILFFGLIAVGGTYYLQTDRIDTSALVAGLQIGLLSTVLLAINNLRDIHGDRESRKNTLAVRFGKVFGKFEITALCLAPFVLGGYWMGYGMRGAAFLPLLSLPLALLVSSRVMMHEPGPIYNQFLAKSALLLVLFGALSSIGYFWA